jgi:hypothetical protein
MHVTNFDNVRNGDNTFDFWNLPLYGPSSAGDNESEYSLSPMSLGPIAALGDSFANESDVNKDLADIRSTDWPLETTSLVADPAPPAPMVTTFLESDAGPQLVFSAIELQTYLADNGLCGLQLNVTQRSLSPADPASPTVPHQHPGTVPIPINATDAQIPLSAAAIENATTGNDTHFTIKNADSRYSIFKNIALMI